MDHSATNPEERTTGRDTRLTFSEEFISGLRIRWDQRVKAANTSSREQEAHHEPLYDAIYEEALELMAQDEGRSPQDHERPRSYKRHRLKGPSQEKANPRVPG